MAYVRRMFGVCLPYVRRISADHPPYIRRMSAVYPPYLIAHFPVKIMPTNYIRKSKLKTRKIEISCILKKGVAEF